MSGIQWKTTKHEKKQENTALNEEKKQLIKINLELTQMLELADKDIKTAILTTFHMFKKLNKGLENISFLKLQFSF